MAKTTITCPQCSTHIDLGGLFKDLPDTTTCPVCKTVIDVASVAAKHDESKKGLVSVIKYEGGLRHFAQFVSEKLSIGEVEEITQQDIRDWQITLSDNGAAVATVAGQIVSFAHPPLALTASTM